MSREWSKYQLAIFDAYENTKSNLFIKATAGSSKTSCSIECLKRTSPLKTAIFLAFNKSIADELKEKIPERIETSTFHSKGFRILLQNVKCRPKINENKCFQIGLKTLDLKEMEYKHKMKYLFDLQLIWNQLRMNLSTNYKQDIFLICEERSLDYKERMTDDIDVISEKWRIGINHMSSEDAFNMDFTDMLWIPYVKLTADDFPKYDVVFLEEGQDLNSLQKEFALRLIKKRGRFIISGDFFQAIYGFQGASVDNFTAFQNLPNTLTLPLSITYRCAKAIVEEAKKVFPNEIEAAPWAEEGIVRRGDLKEAEPGDFVLCRNNLPLIDAFMYFLSVKKKAIIKGKDLGEALLILINKIRDIKDLDLLLEEKIIDLTKRGISRETAKNNPSYIALEEKCIILKMLHSRWNNFDALRTTIEEIFTDKIGKEIVLCTCHKSKGLEADRVFFLNSDLIPSKRAITEKALYGENCLKFVTITRARKELIYCNI